MTLTHTPTLTLAPALETFAVRLENRDEGAWQTLLSQVNPVFGDPIAAQIAHLMKTYAADGEYDGDLIRKMLSEKDATRDEDEDEGWASAGGPPLPGRRFIDGEWKTVPYAEWTAADKALAEEIYRAEESDEEEDMKEWCARRARFLNRLDKDKLIELVLMDEMRKDDYIHEHM